MPSRLCPISRIAPVVRGLTLLALVLLCSGLTARAGVFYDASLGLDVGDDARIFLNITNDYYAPQATVATRIVQRCPRPENDFPVIMLLARASHRPPDAILQLWLTNRSWADIMFELNVPPSVLFVGLNRDPGPPYGKAWGRYKEHHGRGPLVISDRDVVELAKLQIASGYYHVNPYSVIAERQKGTKIERYAADRHRARQGEENGARGKGKRPNKEGGSENDSSKGHGHGHGEEHGNKPHGKPNGH
ncbi:MAG TPA: hypothetical protein VFT43_12455 [Candidatus Polarisedimenticolia bacterium]|nr:hypothetical protein [Candidatus Polarisedimenticolia bacterium]